MTQSEPVALKPCPFCGNDKNIAIANERHDHSGGYFIACPVCMASTGLRFACGDDPRPLLVEQWNQRTTHVLSDEQILRFAAETLPWAVRNSDDMEPDDVIAFARAILAATKQGADKE